MLVITVRSPTFVQVTLASSDSSSILTYIDKISWYLLNLAFCTSIVALVILPSSSMHSLDSILMVPTTFMFVAQ